MSGVTPLVDTLLATRLGQRVDLVPLKAQVEIAGPGAVTHVEQVDNDVRLPSREALQRQLGVGMARRDGPQLEFSPARPVGAVTLSAAARTVSALLNLPVGTTPAVRGRAPLQADLRAPVAAPVLAAALARAVGESGLFYESHLQQYAAGLRTLGQLAQEPQAAIPSPAARAAAPVAPLAPPVAAAAPLADVAAVAAMTAATAFATPPGEAAALPVLPLEAGSSLETAAAPPAGRAAPDAGGPDGAPSAPAAGTAVRPEPAGPATTYGRTGLPDQVPSSVQDFSVQDADAQGPGAASADGVRAGHPVAAIHPDVVGLVRQQLELLAAPVFRWSGEGWPEVPMDWEIRQEREGHAADGSPETAPSVWTTRMTLKLPRLGAVDVRLGLAGATLQLRLAASQETTVAVLNQACADLPRRFGAVGLELTALQIGGEMPKAGAAGPAGDGDAE
jgi:hypothetical protein